MKSRSRRSVGGKVRPSTAKTLEKLAGILAPNLEGARVLDLFAGTGRVGFRMLEEGASEVLFVESHRRVAGELKGQIRSHSRRQDCSLLVGVVPKVLEKIRGLYDIVLCDPPYDWEGRQQLLPALIPLVTPSSLVVVEHHHKSPYENSKDWELYRSEKMGETRLSFFALK